MRTSIRFDNVMCGFMRMFIYISQDDNINVRNHNFSRYNCFQLACQVITVDSSSHLLYYSLRDSPHNHNLSLRSCKSGMKESGAWEKEERKRE